MTAGIEIEIGEVRGPWANVLIEGRKKGHVMSIIPAHLGPGFSVSVHTSKPEMFAGMWELPANTKESASGVKLIAIKLEMLSEDFEGIDLFVRRWGFKLMVDKPRVGFFDIEGVAIVSDRNITRGDQLMEILYEQPVILEAILVSRVVRQCLNSDASFIGPSVGE